MPTPVQVLVPSLLAVAGMVSVFSPEQPPIIMSEDDRFDRSNLLMSRLVSLEQLENMFSMSFTLAVLKLPTYM